MSNVNNPLIQRPAVQIVAVRALDVAYRNLTGHPLYITITVSSQAAGGNYCQVRTDSTGVLATADTIRAVFSADGTLSITSLPMSFIVLPGDYYKVVTVTGTVVLLFWVEWN